MVEGWDVLNRMESTKTDSSDRPKDEITISDSGAIDVDEPYNIQDW